MVPLTASPALADVAPPYGCTEITDNSGVSGFGLHDNGHNVRATTARAAQCWQFLNNVSSTEWQSDVNAIHATDDIRNMNLTDGTGGNPYAGLATYFANETAYVASLSC